MRTEPEPATERGESSGSFLKDGFDSERPELWTITGTGWSYNGGILIQTVPSRDKQFVRSTSTHPPDFDLTVDFRTTGGATYKSVGIRFDVADDGKNSHTVYASAHGPGPKVQVSHTRDSKTSYPAGGKATYPIVVDEDYELRVQVHLAQAEAKDLWDELEHKYNELEGRVKRLGREAEEPLEEVGPILTRAWMEGG